MAQLLDYCVLIYHIAPLTGPHSLGTWDRLDAHRDRCWENMQRNVSDPEKIIVYEQIVAEQWSLCSVKAELDDAQDEQALT